MSETDRAFEKIIRPLVTHELHRQVEERLTGPAFERLLAQGIAARLEAVEFTKDATSLLASVVNNETFAARVREIAEYVVRTEVSGHLADRLPEMVSVELVRPTVVELVPELVAEAVEEELRSPECQQAIREQVMEHLRKTLYNFVDSLLCRKVSTIDYEPAEPGAAANRPRE